MKTFERAQLISAAKELNSEFGLEPAIKVTKATSDEAIISGIQKASEMYDPDNDELTDETLEVMEGLKEEAPASKSKKGAAKPKAKVEDDPEPEAEVEAEVEVDEETAAMLESLKTTKKREALLELLDDELFDDVRDELANEKNPIKLRGAMKRHITGDEPSPATPAVTKKAEKKGGKKEPSVYGTGVELMVKNPDQSFDALMKALEKSGLSTKGKESAARTAYGTVTKITKLLIAAGWKRP